MRCSARYAWLISLLLLGCNQNPFLANQPTPPGQNAPYVAQMQDMDRRATALDVDNRELHAEVARIQQKNQLLFYR